jgi:excisionase family DNA binding protein
MSTATAYPDLQRASSSTSEFVHTAEQNMPADDRLLRASEVQRELGISRATAYRMMTDGTLPVYRFGGRKGRRAMVRVSYKELRMWIAAHRAMSPKVASSTC